MKFAVNAQSQNRTPQEGKAGQALKNHRERGIEIYLFVRRYPKTQKATAASLTYWGELDFLEWQGERPITVRWRMQDAVPGRLWGVLGVAG